MLAFPAGQGAHLCPQHQGLLSLNRIGHGFLISSCLGDGNSHPTLLKGDVVFLVLCFESASGQPYKRLDRRVRTGLKGWVPSAKMVSALCPSIPVPTASLPPLREWCRVPGKTSAGGS